MHELTRGDVAEQAAVHVETLRYYERRGLIPKPRRTATNYRIYSPDTIRLVRFVKRAQELGFALDEIKELLSLRATPNARCADIRRRAEAKMQDIDEKMRALRRMRRALSTLIEECAGERPITDCPILEALATERVR